MRSSQEFEEITQSDQPNLILAGGIAFSLMLFALIHMQALHGRGWSRSPMSSSSAMPR